MRRHNTALKQAIAASGRKQQTIADLCHIERTKLSHLVCGRRRPKPRERRNLAKWLNRSEAELFPVAVAEQIEGAEV